MYRIVVTRENGQEDTIYMSESRHDTLAYYNDMLYLMRRRKLGWREIVLINEDKAIQSGLGSVIEENANG